MLTVQFTPSSVSTADHPDTRTRLKHRQTLISRAAILGATVMALTGALVAQGANAQTHVAASESAAVVAPANGSASGTSKAKAPHTVKHSHAHSSAVAQTHPKACVNCGTVEAVTAVQREGKVNGVDIGNTTVGVGTVAGGVLGALIGHQVGGGNGKKAATVLGAAGGAYAGNTIEKNMKKVTVYDVRVRMADGSHRNLDISTAPAVGAKVIVEGNNLRMANASS